MQQVNTPGGALTAADIAKLNSNFNSLVPLCRNVYYVDPAAGNDGASGLSIQDAFRTFQVAYNACQAGTNDAVAIVANGATSATVRISASFTWAKDETHLFGVCSGVNLSNRARLAPQTTDTAFTPFFTVSANGCRFDNVSIFDGFTAGTTNQIAVVVSGGRNLFTNCHLAGMGDATSAASAGSRSLKITGTGENQFIGCTIGVDTVARTNANATLEFAGGTPRNEFIECVFPMLAGSNAEFFILGTGAACMDRFQLFKNCKFINAMSSGATKITAAASLTNAAPGGLLYFTGSCAVLGATKWGDTNALANSYVDAGAPAQSTSGLAVVPS